MVLHLVFGCPLSLRALMVSKAAGLSSQIDYQLYFDATEMEANKRVSGMNGGGQKGPVLETTQGGVYGINSIAKLLVNSPTGKEVGLIGQNLWENSEIEGWLAFLRGLVEDLRKIKQNFWAFQEKKFVCQKNFIGLWTKLAAIDKHLEGKSYFMGERVTLLDITLATMLWGPRGLPMVGQENMQTKFKNINKFYKKVVGSELFTSSLGETTKLWAKK